MRYRLGILAILAPVVLTVLLIVLPVPGDSPGVYKGISRSLFCSSTPVCRHEIGHMMDHDLGYPSRSIEFSNAVMTYLYTEIKYFDAGQDELVSAVFGTSGIFYFDEDYQAFGKRSQESPQQELYANIYQVVDGDIGRLPEILRPFYSPDPKYRELHNCLTRAPVRLFRLCGRALYIAP